MRSRGKRTRRISAWFEIVVFGTLAVLLAILGSGIVWTLLVPLPPINQFENRKIAESTKLYDRTGNIVLYDVHGTVRRTSVPLDKISPYIRNATIAIEDATFWEHSGFRPAAFARAAITNILSGSYAQGGSTITQQVVKNALLTQNKTIARKLGEIILAMRLERVYTKEQILNAYLNETSYGGTIYGVQEASQYFFGKDAADVSLAEAAYLAALPKAPTRYSPYGAHRDLLDARQKLVLQKMLENRLITEEEYQRALSEKVSFIDERDEGIKAPHFVFFIREYLEEKYGADVVSNGGLRVITTLDYDLQKKAEEVVSSDVPVMEKNFNASNAGVSAIDPRTGQILAMVGSRGYFDPAIDGKVNVTLAKRQPGSSFKPFVYATAFKKGYTPETVLFDLKTQFSTACQPSDIASDTPPCYSPENFDGKFHGPITMRDALAQSVNVPSVKVLYLAGVDDSIKTASALGITTLADAARYGLTLVLGGGEVTLLEMTGAYATFANDGVRNLPTGILRVEDRNGSVLESYQDKNERVLDSEIARKISNILSDNNARAPEFGINSPLYFPTYDVASKTGTTNDYRDVWIIGYTPSIAIGAWAGNNDNSPMQKKIAAFIVAPLWHKIMSYAIEKYLADPFPPPAPDPDVAALPPSLTGVWNVDPVRGVHEILYWVNKNNPRSGAPDLTDPQLPYWDYPVQLWASSMRSGTVGSETPFLQHSTRSGLHIVSPISGAVLPLGAPVTFTVENSSTKPVSSVLYYVNGGLIGQSVRTPYTTSWRPDLRGPALLRVVAIHPDGSTDEQTTLFTVQ